MSAALPNLTEAVKQANITLSERGYTVKVKNQKVEPKDPIFLQIQYTD